MEGTVLAFSGHFRYRIQRMLDVEAKLMLLLHDLDTAIDTGERIEYSNYMIVVFLPALDMIVSFSISQTHC